MRYIESVCVWTGSVGCCQVGMDRTGYSACEGLGIARAEFAGVWLCVS
jgi:hypothetical protein